MSLLNEPVPPEVDRFLDYSMEVSRVIIAVLRQNKWNAHDLGKFVGYPAWQVSNWCSGRHNFTIRTLAKIRAKLCNVPEATVFIDYSMVISNEIMNYMDEHKLTKSGLAKRLKVPKSRVSEYLSGMYNFTLRTIAKIETGLNINLKLPTLTTK
jgi:antitoxin component HigA of HigAB toxin-antitoxin module